MMKSIITTVLLLTITACGGGGGNGDSGILGMPDSTIPDVITPTKPTVPTVPTEPTEPSLPIIPDGESVVSLQLLPESAEVQVLVMMTNKDGELINQFPDSNVRQEYTVEATFSDGTTKDVTEQIVDLVASMDTPNEDECTDNCTMRRTLMSNDEMDIDDSDMSIASYMTGEITPTAIVNIDGVEMEASAKLMVQPHLVITLNDTTIPMGLSADPRAFLIGSLGEQTSVTYITNIVNARGYLSWVSTNPNIISVEPFSIRSLAAGTSNLSATYYADGVEITSNTLAITVPNNTPEDLWISSHQTAQMSMLDIPTDFGLNIWPKTNINYAYRAYLKYSNGDIIDVTHDRNLNGGGGTTNYDSYIGYSVVFDSEFMGDTIPTKHTALVYDPALPEPLNPAYDVSAAVKTLKSLSLRPIANLFDRSPISLNFAYLGTPLQLNTIATYHYELDDTTYYSTEDVTGTAILTSSNPDVATVDSSTGLLTPISAGNTTVTVEMTNGSEDPVTYSTDITVGEEVNPIALIINDGSSTHEPDLSTVPVFNIRQNTNSSLGMQILYEDGVQKTFSTFDNMIISWSSDKGDDSLYTLVHNPRYGVPYISMKQFYTRMLVENDVPDETLTITVNIDGVELTSNVIVHFEQGIPRISTDEYCTSQESSVPTPQQFQDAAALLGDNPDLCNLYGLPYNGQCGANSSQNTYIQDTGDQSIDYPSYIDSKWVFGDTNPYRFVSGDILDSSGVLTNPTEFNGISNFICLNDPYFDAVR